MNEIKRGAHLIVRHETTDQLWLDLQVYPHAVDACPVSPSGATEYHDAHSFTIDDHNVRIATDDEIKSLDILWGVR